jgi:hypothetical protein
MRILVVEDQAGDSVETILDLVDAGHRVVRCQPVNGTVAPCAGLGGGGECPLATPVDAVVDVRSGEAFELRELGALCAARTGVPIVSVGSVAPPFPAVRTSPEGLLETLALVARAQ